MRLCRWRHVRSASLAVRRPAAQNTGDLRPRISVAENIGRMIKNDATCQQFTAPSRPCAKAAAMGGDCHGERARRAVVAGSHSEVRRRAASQRERDRNGRNPQEDLAGTIAAAEPRGDRLQQRRPWRVRNVRGTSRRGAVAYSRWNWHGQASRPTSTVPVLRSSDGCVHRSGYVYQMFLPGTGGRWQPEARDGGAIAGVDDERASQDWICYAWPIEPGVTGKRSFFIDSRGNYVAQHSATHGYGGDRRPLAGIAAHVFDNGTWGIAANTVDVLGDCWVVVN